MLDGFAARLPARDAGLYPFVFQRFPEPIGIISGPAEERVLCRPFDRDLVLQTPVRRQE